MNNFVKFYLKKSKSKVKFYCVKHIYLNLKALYYLTEHHVPHHLCKKVNVAEKADQ